MEKISTDMEYEDDVSFYKASRIAKMCFIGLMFMISVAAMAGAFGYGFWTKKTAGNNNDMLIEYECFLRESKETPLTFYIQTINPSDSLIRISLNNEYFEKVDLKHISPEPCEVITDNGRSIFCFKTTTGINASRRVSFTTVAKESGKVNATIHSGRNEYLISQFIYP